MKVLFLTPMGGKDVLYLTNEVYDLEKGLAKRLINNGTCVEYVEEKVQVKKAVVGKSTKVTKKKAK